METKCSTFYCEKAPFFKFYEFNLDLDHNFEKKLDYGWTLTEF